MLKYFKDHLDNLPAEGFALEENLINEIKKTFSSEIEELVMTK